MMRRLVRRDDRGHASVILLSGLMFSLLAIVMLFVRLGNANDLRSQAQTAADAAALAAVGDTQSRMVDALANGDILHFSTWSQESGEDAAHRYAKKNKGVATDIRASDNMYGYSGNHVRVEVRGAKCQRELDKQRERESADIVCKGNEKKKDIDTFSGEAAATARIDAPDCTLEEISKDTFLPKCAGTIIRNKSDARSVIDVKLVDDEGKYLYEPGVSSDNSDLGGGDMGPCDAPNASNVTPLMCATHQEILKKFPHFAQPAESGCYRDGNPSTSEHPKGRACDYMTNQRGGYSKGEEKALGDALSKYLQKNAKKLGIMYIIWEQRIWKPGEGSWEEMEDRGSPNENHYNHVHVSVN